MKSEIKELGSSLYPSTNVYITDDLTDDQLSGNEIIDYSVIVVQENVLELEKLYLRLKDNTAFILDKLDKQQAKFIYGKSVRKISKKMLYSITEFIPYDSFVFITKEIHLI